MKDLTIVYITANVIKPEFAKSIRRNLLKAVGKTPIVSVSKEPINFGDNIVFLQPRHHVNIYRCALEGAKVAQTKYIAIAEDDILYSPQHFKHRPTDQTFAYNLACWGIYTWVDPPIFSHKFVGRRNHGTLICERDLYIEAMNERFAKYPDISEINLALWSEPGKYEKQLGVTERASETFYTDIPNIMFSHPEGLSYDGLGKRKRLGELKANEIPYWGRAEKVIKIYK